MTCDYKYLGTHAEYPGHPITIAYLIILTFDSYEAAIVRALDTNCPAALESGEIPGAGGNVYAALEFLGKVRNVCSIHDAFTWADEYWTRCDDQKERNPGKWIAGQSQADDLKPKVTSKIYSWLNNNSVGHEE